MAKQNQEPEHFLSEEIRGKIKDQLDASVYLPISTLEAVKTIAEWNRQAIELVLRVLLEL